MQKLFFYFSLITFLISVSCNKETPEPGPDNNIDSYENGTFVSCEGGFGSGNSTVYFLDLDKGLYTPDIYSTTNNELLGDVLQSITFQGDKAYLVVNNSGKIEVVEKKSFAKTGTITGLSSPTEIVIQNQKGYVGDLFGDQITIVDLNTNEIADRIFIGMTSAKIVLEGSRLYILSPTDYMGRVKDHIYTLDINSQKLDSIAIGSNPIDWTYDGKGQLYIYAQGEEGNNLPGIYTINTVSGEKSGEKELNSDQGFFGKVTYDAFQKRVLFTQEGGIYAYNTSTQEISSSPIVLLDEITFLYGLGVDPATGEIYVGDARDFNQNGAILIYTGTGELFTGLNVGVGPNNFYFE